MCACVYGEEESGIVSLYTHYFTKRNGKLVLQQCACEWEFGGSNIS